MAKAWQTKTLAVANLHLDARNPRLGRGATSWSPNQIAQYLFDHDKAMVVAESIARNGYFPNEPLLAVKEDKRWVVIEGNRRLAALKALREPGMLEGKAATQAERLARRIDDPSSVKQAPVTIAPSRRAADRIVVGRHIGTPVLAWRGENRASFILEKVDEGYTNDDLRDQLGFSDAQIAEARQTRAIADMARSLDLSDDVKEKLNSPRTNVFTTLERVFDSTVGRKYMMVKTDPDHGLRGTTTKKEFVRGFTRLVTDVATGEQSSRSLNTNENIKAYFESWDKKERPKKKQGSFVPSDVVADKTGGAPTPAPKAKKAKRSKQPSKTVLPRDFKIRHGSERLIDLHRELTRLKRDDFPNAGAVLLRVFLELGVRHYLDRIGELKGITARIRKKGKMPFGVPTMRQLSPEVTRIAKANLPAGKAKLVEKAIRYDSSAPFTISDLHAFVHSDDMPGSRDILQFWIRTEPLFRLMLEQDPEDAEQ